MTCPKCGYHDQRILAKYCQRCCAELKPKGKSAA